MASTTTRVVGHVLQSLRRVAHNSQNNMISQRSMSTQLIGGRSILGRPNSRIIGSRREFVVKDGSQVCAEVRMRLLS